MEVYQPSPTTNARSILHDRLALGSYGSSHHGARDYFEVLGYPKQLSIDDYLIKFERDPLGGRIVEFPPDETWRDTPTVKDGRDKNALGRYGLRPRLERLCRRDARLSLLPARRYAVWHWPL